MSRELEDRLERVADTLPTSTADSRDRARHAALATFRRPRRRRRAAILLIPAVLAVVAATAAILAAPWGDGPLATERALAVLGDQPVVHAIIEQPGPGGAVIDLESGEERPTEGQRTEYWYDDARDYLRARVSVGGRHLPGGRTSTRPRVSSPTSVSGAGRRRASTPRSRGSPAATGRRSKAATPGWSAKRSSMAATRSFCGSLCRQMIPRASRSRRRSRSTGTRTGRSVFAFPRPIFPGRSLGQRRRASS